MMVDTVDALDLAPPGPGTWQRDEVHWPRPIPRSYTEIYTDASVAGFRRFSARYGVLIDYFEQRFPHGFAYGRFHMVGEPDRPKGGPPPGPVMWLVARLHPALRKRTRVAKDVLATRRWLEDRHRWETEAKPASIAANRALQSVRLHDLDDEDLIGHLRRCRDHLAAMIAQHHDFNGPGVLPSGLLYAMVMDATSEPGAGAALLTGASPISSGRSAELTALVEAIRAEPSASAALEDPDPARALVRLREAVPSAYEPFFDTTCHRLVGDTIDIGSPTFAEQPGLMVQTIRSAVERPPAGPDEGRVGALIASVRERIEPARRHEFDQLLLDARECAGVRDERSVYGDVWACGIYRLALLEAGRRAVAAGRLEAPDHMVDATLDEVCAILRGDAAAPRVTEMADRDAFRRAHTSTVTPAFLGDPPGSPPSLGVLPRALRTVNVALMAQVASMINEADAESGPGIVRGLPASPGSYEGIARLIAGPHEFDRIRSGDVLVTRTTSEAFNVVLPLLGAIVCDRGGPLSHAAIVSRECGIPCVVGSSDGTTLIPDGARVLVDGDTGEVTVLG